MEEYRLLKYIYENPNSSQKEMSEMLDIFIGNVNNLIKNMNEYSLLKLK